MASPLIYDVGMHNFVNDVVQKSMEVPVLLDFWAEWCGPCKTLTPTLERLAEAYGGRFVLAKCNTEENPELAQRFGIRSIPAVKLVVQGQLAGEFNGAQPEGEIRRFLDHYLPPPPQDHMALADELIAQGELGDALAVIEQLLRDQPMHAKGQPLKAQLLIQLGRWDLASEYLQTANFAEADGLRRQLAVFAEAPGSDALPALAAKLEKDPLDHEARFQLALGQARSGQFREALENLLHILSKQKTFGEGKVPKTLLGIFELIGIHHPLSDESRRRMSRLMF